MNYPFTTTTSTETSSALLTELLTRLASFAVRLDDAIYSIQRSESFYEQWVIGGCVVFLAYYFARKNKTIKSIEVSALRWIDDLLEPIADRLWGKVGSK